MQAPEPAEDSPSWQGIIWSQRLAVPGWREPVPVIPRPSYAVVTLVNLHLEVSCQVFIQSSKQSLVKTIDSVLWYESSRNAGSFCVCTGWNQSVYLQFAAPLSTLFFPQRAELIEDSFSSMSRGFHWVPTKTHSLGEWMPMTWFGSQWLYWFPSS